MSDDVRCPGCGHQRVDHRAGCECAENRGLCMCALRLAEIDAVLAMREVENVTDEEAGRILGGKDDDDDYGCGYGDVRGNLVIIDTYFDMPQIPRVAAVLNVLAMRAASKEAT